MIDCDVAAMESYMSQPEPNPTESDGVREEFLLNYFKGILPRFRKQAMYMGYAIAVHGSLRRDFDLVAVPWTEDAVETIKLVDALADIINVPDDAPYPRYTEAKVLNRELFHLFTPNYYNAIRDKDKKSSGYIELSITPNIQTLTDQVTAQKVVLEKVNFEMLIIKNQLAVIEHYEYHGDLIRLKPIGKCADDVLEALKELDQS